MNYKRKNIFNIIAILAICAILFSNSKTHIKVYKINRMYNNINSDNPKYSISDSVYNLVKYDIVKQVEESNLYKKCNKKNILDSLKSIKIKIVEPNIIINESFAAMFVDIKSVTTELNKISVFEHLKTDYSDIILLQKRKLNDEYVAEMLIHEHYHYLDKLLNYKSDTIKKYNLSDKKITSVRHKINKIFYLFGFNDDKNTDELELTALSISSSINNDIGYLTDSKEVFVRWKTFKSKLVNLNYIYNINSTVDTTIIKEYFDKHTPNVFDLELLLTLDLDKLEILDKITN